jgi:hypothetical protein
MIVRGMRHVPAGTGAFYYSITQDFVLGSAESSRRAGREHQDVTPQSVAITYFEKLLRPFRRTLCIEHRELLKVRSG